MPTRMRLALAGSATLFLLAFATPAQAQLRFGLGGGASVPSGVFDDAADVGFHLTGLVTTLVPLSPMGFRGEVSVTQFDAAGQRNGDYRVIDGTANVLLTPGTYMTAKPYFIAGIGAYNVEEPRDGESGTRIGVNGGFGLTFGMGAMQTFLEARWVSVNAGGGTRLSYVPVSFGLMF